MRFSLGKRGDSDDSERTDAGPGAAATSNGGPAGNGNGNGAGVSSHDIAQSGGAADPRTGGADAGQRADGQLSDDFEFDDAPALIGERQNGGPARQTDDGAQPGQSRPASANGVVSASRSDAGRSDDDEAPVAGGAGAPSLENDDTFEHVPLGEGPMPAIEEGEERPSGLAVPGAGSDPSVDSQAAMEEAESGSDSESGARPASDGERTSRVSVVDEQPPRPEPPAGATEEEYKWHTYKVYPSGRPDAVEFIDTYRAFGKSRILRGLNMGLPEGMVSMILGPSGTGKSVCIKHMVGLLYPDQGDVLVHGRSVPNMVDDELFEMRKKFGLLFQDGALFGSMNLYDNVAFPLRQHTEKGEDEIEEIVMRRLDEVGLGHSRDKYPNELSGGMRKRAGFARALVLGPDIVLFDEPDSGLDPVRTSLLGELILEVHRDMMDEAKAAQKPHLPTFCVITHNVMMARRTADYINVLWKGRIVEAGPTEDMLNSPNPFIRQFLAGESMGPLTMD